MADQEIKLLEQQIERLTAKNFNLESWKSYTLLVLLKIFGAENEFVRQIEQIDFSYNSWSLRDASGNESYEEGKKGQAREILQAAIDELTIYGVPKNRLRSEEQFAHELMNLILDELKGSQVKQLKSILTSSHDEEEKKRLIRELLSELSQNSLNSLVTEILMSRNFQKLIVSKS